MIQTLKTLEEAYAVPDPKHIWVNGDEIIVYTESDIPVEDANG